MKILKYSRQRESIKAFLYGRHDHPTADAVYTGIREEFPNISLGTVYRNLNLLVELGEINKVTCGDGKDHFDADTSPHYHFICRNAALSLIFLCSPSAKRKPRQLLLWEPKWTVTQSSSTVPVRIV